MSVVAESDASSNPFAARQRRAGAVLAIRDGRPVALNYGSASGELSVCVSAVGIVCRSELAILALEAPAAWLERLVARIVHPGGVWWCREAPDRALLVCDGAAEAAWRGRLRACSPILRDCSDELAVIEVIGREASHVLAALGLDSECTADRASPFTAAGPEGVDARWLTASDHPGLLVVARDQAESALRAVERAGRDFGISYVGAEAAARYRLLQKVRPSPRRDS